VETTGEDGGKKGTDSSLTKPPEEGQTNPEEEKEKEEETGKEEEKEKEEEEETPKPAFTGQVTSVVEGVLAKGGSRQFRADTEAPVTWSVQGGSEATTISEEGLLSVAAGEPAITLVVRAEAEGKELGTATVKLKGWKDITANLADIFADGNAASKGKSRITGITAAAYGKGIWVVAGHDKDDWMTPVVAWSDDEGVTWHKAEAPLIYEEFSFSIAYGGPKGQEKFVIGGYLSHLIYSSDGKTWTKVSNIVPAILDNRPDLRNPLYQTVWGEVEGGGRFVTANASSKFATSEDGVTWTYRGEAVAGKPETLQNLLYGTGIVAGRRVSMFRGWGGRETYLGAGVEEATRADAYSTDGLTWTALTTQAEREALGFIPAAPTGGSENVAARMADPRGFMFTGAIFAGDKSAYYTVSEYEEYVKKDIEGKTFYIKEEIRGTDKGYKYVNGVRFMAEGGGKYLVIGAGNRAALAHKECF
jgi:hypothetical protein